MTPETLWFTRCPAPTAASVAIALGWLADEFAADGIEVRSIAASGDRRIHQSHYSHAQPNSFRFGGYVPPLIARSRGSDLRVIAISWPDRAAGIFSLPSSGIREQGDLRGRRLGVPRRLNDAIDWRRGSVLAGYGLALRMAGIDRDEVTFVDVDIAREYVADANSGSRRGQSLWGARSQFALQREEAAALVRGEIDVIFSDGAVASLLRAFLGLHRIADLASYEDRPTTSEGHPYILTVSGALIDQNPELAARWVSRLLDVDRWSRNHEEEAKRIIARESGLPEELVEEAFSARVHRQLDLSLAPGRLTLLERRYRLLLEQGVLEGPIDFGELIDRRPLDLALSSRGALPVPRHLPAAK